MQVQSSDIKTALRDLDKKLGREFDGAYKIFNG